MADAGILTIVKKALGITGTYQDDTLNVYIDEVISYMVDAGVPSSVVNSPASAGVISRGVTDLWNYGSAGGKLSDYFYQRVTQLSYNFTPDDLDEISQETIDEALGVTHDELG